MGTTSAVRDSMVVYGGKTPVDLVFGRPPRDIVPIEHSSPEQLTTPETARDLADRQLQKLAMKSYSETRQRGDLQRDIAARILPMAGLVAPSDRVYYCQIDKSQVKHGTISDRWYKARVLSQERAICVIDT